MAKRIKRSTEFYALALKGSKDNLGLRETAIGFSAADGYNLRRLDQLTPAQKAKITKAFHELQQLTAQPRYVYKPKSRSKKDLEKLAKAQKAVQGDARYKWKVAFVPHVPAKTKRGKEKKPRLYFGKRGITIKESGYERIYISLDPENLVTNPAAEIAAAIKSDAPKAQRFTIQAGTNEMPVLSDKKGVIQRVINLMNKYDGVTPLPAGSGNAGDNPAYHKWDKWLHGLIGYKFPKASGKAISDAVNTFDEARKDLQKKRRAARERVRYHSKKRR